MKIKTVCPFCKKPHYIELDPDEEKAYERYTTEHGLIQNYFPTWPAEKRELLMTGICSDCWDDIF